MAQYHVTEKFVTTKNQKTKETACQRARKLRHALWQMQKLTVPAIQHKNPTYMQKTAVPYLHLTSL
jgi:hypothetical protein